MTNDKSLNHSDVESNQSGDNLTKSVKGSCFDFIVGHNTCEGRTKLGHGKRLTSAAYSSGYALCPKDYMRVRRR